MVQDTMEAMDDDEIEEEAEEEVNKVLFQITDGKTGGRLNSHDQSMEAPLFLTNVLPSESVSGLLGEAPVAAGTLPTEAEEEEEPELDDMQRRLEALKS